MLAAQQGRVGVIAFHAIQPLGIKLDLGLFRVIFKGIRLARFGIPAGCFIHFLPAPVVVPDRIQYFFQLVESSERSYLPVFRERSR